MSLFPRTFQEFHPLFRLIDDYDRASRTLTRDSLSQLRSFQPKFDVKELKDSYELQGELPGIDQKDVSIEWTDGNTLTISGRTEHRFEKGTPPQGQIEEAQDDEGTKGGQHEYQKPSVEDEGQSSQAVTTTEKSGEVAKPAEEQVKYWVSERSVGEFHRSFSFPTRVDHDAVKASMKNGILSIVVPKAKAQQPKKVNIE